MPCCYERWAVPGAGGGACAWRQPPELAVLTLIFLRPAASRQSGPRADGGWAHGTARISDRQQLLRQPADQRKPVLILGRCNYCPAIPDARAPLPDHRPAPSSGLVPGRLLRPAIEQQRHIPVRSVRASGNVSRTDVARRWGCVPNILRYRRIMVTDPKGELAMLTGGTGARVSGQSDRQARPVRRLHPGRPPTRSTRSTLIDHDSRPDRRVPGYSANALVIRSGMNRSRTGTTTPSFLTAIGAAFVAAMKTEAELRNLPTRAASARQPRALQQIRRRRAAAPVCSGCWPASDTC